MICEAARPQALLDEDAIIGAPQINVTRVEITPIDEVFAR